MFIFAKIEALCVWMIPWGSCAPKHGSRVHLKISIFSPICQNKRKQGMDDCPVLLLNVSGQV
jgi:hypothetical protein